MNNCGTYTDFSTWDVFCAFVKNNKSANEYMIDTIGNGSYTVNGRYINDKQHRKQIYCHSLNEVFQAIDETEYYFE